MYRFVSLIAWYYVIAIGAVILTSLKDKRAGKEVSFSDVNLDIPIISLIYIVYYYAGGFGAP
jgi:hypothetical protein